MADKHIKSHPERDKEMKDKEDFATQNFNDKTDSLSQATLDKIKKEFGDSKEEKKEEKKEDPKNFVVNYITDEEFKKELDYLGFTPQGESVIVLGPKIKMPKSVRDGGLTLDDNTRRDLEAKELAKHYSGYRVVSISPFVSLQQMEPFLRVAETVGKLGGELTLPQKPYREGDYVFTKPGPNGFQVVRQNLIFKPLNDELSYYEVFHREVNHFQTQEQVERFRVKSEDEVKVEEDGESSSTT